MLRITNSLINLPRFFKRVILTLNDLFIIFISLWISFSLRFGDFFWQESISTSYYFSESFYKYIKVDFSDLAWLFIASSLIGIMVFSFFGMYRTYVRYIGNRAIWVIFQAVTLYILIISSFVFISGLTGIPRSIFIINLFITMFFITGSRLLIRYLLLRISSVKDQRSGIKTSNVLIFGAGSAGRQLARSILNAPEFSLYGFIDDNKEMHNQKIFDYPVFSQKELERVIHRYEIENILLAIPSISRQDRLDIIRRLQPLGIRIKTLPAITDLIGGKISLNLLHDLEIDDLLGRESVSIDFDFVKEKIMDSVILVTGAGGSIGSQICKELIFFQPKIILLLEINEFALYEIHNKLVKRLENHSDLSIKIIPVLGSVQNFDRMRDLMHIWKPKYIYHTAAYKHVPMVEHNSSEGIQNNVFGTLVCAFAALKEEIENFVLISTDKAVRPTNIMGATKRLAEMSLQALSSEEIINFDLMNLKSKLKIKTNFSIVRFGNVIGSSGSVIPLFRNQIASGGPITLTHKDITRYFMSIDEAAKLVIHSGCMNSGKDKIRNAEVFVLDMGKPVKIFDLAKSMVELSGMVLKSDDQKIGDIEIKITGLRPGEKLYEELLIGNNPLKTSHKKILKAHENFIPWNNLQKELKSLRDAIEKNDFDVIQKILVKVVDGYNNSNKVADWIYLEKSS